MNKMKLAIYCIALIGLIATSGCSSTRSENGVTIEKQGGLF